MHLHWLFHTLNSRVTEYCKWNRSYITHSWRLCLFSHCWQWPLPAAMLDLQNVLMSHPGYPGSLAILKLLSIPSILNIPVTDTYNCRCIEYIMHELCFYILGMKEPEFVHCFRHPFCKGTPGTSPNGFVCCHIDKGMSYFDHGRCFNCWLPYLLGM